MSTHPVPVYVVSPGMVENRPMRAQLLALQKLGACVQVMPKVGGPSFPLDQWLKQKEPA